MKNQELDTESQAWTKDRQVVSLMDAARFFGVMSLVIGAFLTIMCCYWLWQSHSGYPLFDLGVAAKNTPWVFALAGMLLIQAVLVYVMTKAWTAGSAGAFVGLCWGQVAFFALAGVFGMFAFEPLWVVLALSVCLLVIQGFYLIARRVNTHASSRSIPDPDAT